MEVESHYDTAIFRSDVSLTLAWGLPYECGRSWTENWATYPDRTVRAFWADVLWNGALIDRQLMLSVDGGRCTLPSPRPKVQNLDEADAKVVGYEVTRLRWAFARLVDSLGGGISEFDRYFEQSGIQVVG